MLRNPCYCSTYIDNSLSFGPGVEVPGEESPQDAAPAGGGPIFRPSYLTYPALTVDLTPSRLPGGTAREPTNGPGETAGEPTNGRGETAGEPTNGRGGTAGESTNGHGGSAGEPTAATPTGSPAGQPAAAVPPAVAAPAPVCPSCRGRQPAAKGAIPDDGTSEPLRTGIGTFFGLCVAMRQDSCLVRGRSTPAQCGQLHFKLWVRTS